jgi:hypothetical protein
MAGRASIGEISEADFSSLLAALSASPKGRSFLAEYRRRSRPDETQTLIDSLRRIEATIASLKDQLQPARIADELRRVSMTLEVATEGAPADPAGDETARRMALIGRVRAELATLATSLAGELTPPAFEPGSEEMRVMWPQAEEPDTPGSARPADQAAAGDGDASAER